MNAELIFLGLFLLAMGALFVSEALPIDLTGIAGLLLLTLLGFISPEAAFSGFSSPAVITLLFMFIVGSALSKTGVAEMAAKFMHRYVGDNERLNIAAVMIVAAVFSAVMNNVATTALFLPAVISLAAEAALPLSRLLIPLSFASLLGGTLTVIGTTSNILVRDQLTGASHETFEFLDFTLVGMALVAVGIIYMVICGPKILPARDVKRRMSGRKERLADLYRLHERLFTLRVCRGSALHGKTLGESQFARNFGVQVIAIERGSNKVLAPRADDILREGDVLVVRGKREELESLLRSGHSADASGGNDMSSASFEMLGDRPVSDLETADVVIKEVVLAPRSAVIGKTLQQLDFREKYGLHVLAIWRGGRPYRTSVSHKVLEFGDALLVYGPSRKFSLLAEDPDYVMLADAPRASLRANRAPFAIIGLLLLTVLSVFEIQPIHISAALAAVVVVAFGAVSLEEAYREIDWRVVFLVGSLLPLSVAFEKAGATSTISNLVVFGIGPFGPYVLLTVLCLLSSFLSQLLDGAVAVMLLGPVTLAAADKLSVSPYPLMMGIALGASVAFLTPFSHKSNLLVMGLGGYRTKDYFKIGAPLTLLLAILIPLLVPMVFPF